MLFSSGQTTLTQLVWPLGSAHYAQATGGCSRPSRESVAALDLPSSPLRPYYTCAFRLASLQSSPHIGSGRLFPPVRGRVVSLNLCSFPPPVVLLTHFVWPLFRAHHTHATGGFSRPSSNSSRRLFPSIKQTCSRSVPGARGQAARACRFLSASTQAPSRIKSAHDDSSAPPPESRNLFLGI